MTTRVSKLFSTGSYEYERSLWPYFELNSNKGLFGFLKRQQCFSIQTNGGVKFLRPQPCKATPVYIPTEPQAYGGEYPGLEDNLPSLQDDDTQHVSFEPIPTCVEDDPTYRVSPVLPGEFVLILHGRSHSALSVYSSDRSLVCLFGP